MTARPPLLGLIVDNFAGGGGASLGIELASWAGPDIAINHDAIALGLHAANHPHCQHLVEDVWAIDPRAVTNGRHVALAWFSPDCKHFSKAKGGRPVEKNIRGLAWVVIRWAATVRPTMIALENVEEFQDWGPLTQDGLPCPERKGRTFDLFVRRLREMGYAVEWRELRACDFGAPTIRKRLFLVARCDGRPIRWPAATHGKPGSLEVASGALQPWRTAAECIDWSIPCPSIFGRERPLAEKTLARIARGVRRFVIDAAQPFIVPVTHSGDLRSHAIDEPLRTITGAQRGEYSLIAPYFVPRHGERPTQEPRCKSVDEPMPVVTATANGASLVAATLAVGCRVLVLDEPTVGVDPQSRNAILSSLWKLTVDELITQLRDGTTVEDKETGEIKKVSPSPAFLSVVVKFLKDNEIDLDDPQNANAKLVDLLSRAKDKVQDLDNPEYISD